MRAALPQPGKLSAAAAPAGASNSHPLSCPAHRRVPCSSSRSSSRSSQQPHHPCRATPQPVGATPHTTTLRQESGGSSSAEAGRRMDALVQDAVVWASQHGLVVGLPASGGSSSSTPVPQDAIIHAPLSLLPVAFPAARFRQAKAAMRAFNTLIDAVARDEGYLEATLAAAARHDDFTARLLALMRASAPARALAAAAAAAAAGGGGEAGSGAPEVVLGVHRSDFMLDAPSGRFLQVELNTIASSFGCLSSLTSQLHAYTLARLAGAAASASLASTSSSRGTAAAAEQQQQQQQQQQQLLQLLDAQRLPANGAMRGIAAALAAGVVAGGGQGAVMVMVVQPGERNAYDQQWLQHTLWQEHGITTHRLSLAEIPDALALQPLPNSSSSSSSSSRDAAQQQQQLVLRATGQVVGLVYFRAGYTPADYPSEREWQARGIIEASTAAKCPSVTYQLAGSKKVQQDLARPGVVERFVGQDTGSELRGLFAGLWSLDDPTDPATAAVIAAAVDAPQQYVLKPQREGGGNNLYGEELAARLRQAGSSGGDGSSDGGGLAAFILMQRIQPPPQRCVFVRGGVAAEDEALSELGIYGTFLRVGEQVVLNEEVGHLVRTKTSSSDEGGVAAGYAVLDSPLLADPGEGLLHPLLEQQPVGTAGAAATEAASRQWGEAGAVLAVAKALLGGG